MPGLSQSGPQLTNIEQPRVWLNGGIRVDRLNTDNVQGVSNLFSDLLYYLLTNKTRAWAKSSVELVDEKALEHG